MNIRKAIVIGALALSSITGATGKAMAEEPKPTTTVSVNANTKPAGLAADMLLGEDASLIMTHQQGDMKLKLIHQQNSSGTFAGDKEYTTLDVSMPFKGWTVTPGVKVVSEAGTHTMSGTLAATKSGEGRTLMLLAGGSDTDRKAGVFSQGRTIDAAVFYFKDTVTGEESKYYSGGIHTKTAGLWYSQTASDDRSITTTLDGKVGVLVAAKQRPDGTGWGLSQFTLGSTPGGIYSVGTGQFVSWVMADQVPRPKMRDLDSYLKNSGTVMGQVAYNKDARGTYTELQLGRKVFSRDGIEVSLGAGPRYFQGPDGSKWLASTETLIRVPVAGTGVDITGRFEQKPEGGIGKTLSLSTTYKF